MSRLKEQYQNEIIDAMIKKFGYKDKDGGAASMEKRKREGYF